MVSKSQIKLLTSLQQKKYRNKLGLFIAEGPKVIKELLTSGVDLDSLFSTEKNLNPAKNEFLVSEKELQKISFFKTANTSVALFKIPPAKPLLKDCTTVVLDSIRDPGNLGTIIRLCDWFGINQLVCSEDTVDCYNPKVSQATMGSIARVQINYTDLTNFIKESKLPIYGASLSGENIYKHTLPEKVILVMGNEANGISSEINSLLTNRITIPQYGEQQDTESLNVASATAILLSELMRS